MEKIMKTLRTVGEGPSLDEMNAWLAANGMGDANDYRAHPRVTVTDDGEVVALRWHRDEKGLRSLDPDRGMRCLRVFVEKTPLKVALPESLTWGSDGWDWWSEGDVVRDFGLLYKSGLYDDDAETALRVLNAKLAAMGKHIGDFAGDDPQELFSIFGSDAGRAAVVLTREEVAR